MSHVPATNSISFWRCCRIYLASKYKRLVHAPKGGNLTNSYTASKDARTTIIKQHPEGWTHTCTKQTLLRDAMLWQRQYNQHMQMQWWSSDPPACCCCRQSRGSGSHRTCSLLLLSMGLSAVSSVTDTAVWLQLKEAVIGPANLLHCR